MDNALFERLLFAGESSTLDYNAVQYPFDGASDEERGELIKDILSLANGWHTGNAFILIGVKEVTGSKSEVLGVTSHLADHMLQQFVNGKTNRVVSFSYSHFEYEGASVGIITVPQQNRPVYLKSKFGKLLPASVYYRQGTSTAVATPEVIAQMGVPLVVEQMLGIHLEKRKTEEVRVDLIFDSSLGLVAVIYNCGDVEAYIKKVEIGQGNERVVMNAVLSLPVADTSGSVANVRLGPGTMDLPARKEGRFSLHRDHLNVIRRMSMGPKDNTWLAVTTYGGEIHRMNGREVFSYLPWVVALWETMAEAEKPKRFTVEIFTSIGSGQYKKTCTLKGTINVPGGIGLRRVTFLGSEGRDHLTPHQENELAQHVLNRVTSGQIGHLTFKVTSDERLNPPS